MNNYFLYDRVSLETYVKYYLCGRLNNTYMYACIYISFHIYMHTRVYIQYMYIYIDKCIHTYIHAYVNTTMARGSPKTTLFP